VCQPVRDDISDITRSNFTMFYAFCLWSWFSPSLVALPPVLWMTSSFHIMDPMARQVMCMPITRQWSHNGHCRKLIGSHALRIKCNHLRWAGITLCSYVYRVFMLITVYTGKKTRLCHTWRSIRFLFLNFPVPHFPVSHF